MSMSRFEARALHGDIRNGSRYRHRNEYRAAYDCARPYVARYLIEQSVEDGQDEHHYHKSEYHVHVQPYFGTVAVVAVEGLTRREVAEVVDEQYERKA